MTQPVRTFGRIPPETASVLQRNVTAVREGVLSVLPPGSADTLRAGALDIILTVVLRDWRENNNTTGLLDQDVTDLQNFVQFALGLGDSVQPAEREMVILSVLKGLMEDWLANWNAPGDPGPPGPID